MPPCNTTPVRTGLMAISVLHQHTTAQIGNLKVIEARINKLYPETHFSKCKAKSLCM